MIKTLSGSYGKVYIYKKESEGVKNVKKFIEIYNHEKKHIYLESTSIREIIAYSSLFHNNIMKSFYINLHNNQYCIKLNYGGISLHDWVKLNTIEQRKKKLKYIIFQILNVLHFIHTSCIIHGDLKPSNILIDENDNIKIIDFGATIFDNTIINYSEDKKNYNMCTYLFSSPEMLSLEYTKKNIDINQKHDIFSFGLIVKYLLVGKFEENFNLFTKLLEAKSNYTLSKNVIDIIGQDTYLLNILINSLIINSKERYSASQLLEYNFFNSYKTIEYIINPRIDIYNNYISDISDRSDDNNRLINNSLLEDRKVVLCSLYEFCKHYKKLYYIVPTINLYDRCIHSSINSPESLLTCFVCLLIVDSTMDFGTIPINYSKVYMFKTIKIIFSQELINIHLWTIVKNLNYKIYNRPFDYYLRKLKYIIEYDIIFKILLDVKNSMLELNILVDLYNLEIEKIVGEKLEIMLNKIQN